MSIQALQVFVSGRPTAQLASADGFEHSLTYRHDARSEDFVSLLMPLRAKSWVWPTLHPFFQVNLPEGFLLAVLREQLGPLLGGEPLDLLAAVGQNMIGRIQVSPEATLTESVRRLDLDGLLHNQNSAIIFTELVKAYATSGVSGVVPKFLTPQTQALFHKRTVSTERYIVKGGSERFPYIALNEHLCMQVARGTGAVVPATEVSDDGRLLVVERFDIDHSTGARLGFEDCCSLLGLAPEDKYQSTWERVSRLIAEHVCPAELPRAREHLATTLLLTYAIGNADCHTKNLALLYSTLEDVRVAPIYDMLSIRAYDEFANSDPGMYVGGVKDWMPGKAFWIFMQQSLGFEPKQQRELVERVCTATSEVFPELLSHIRHTPGFREVGGRMVREWNAGISRLSARSSVVVPDLIAAAHAVGVDIPGAATRAPLVTGGSPLLSRRSKRRRRAS